MDEIKISGVSQFFLFAIPAVLALAALWWLAFGEGLHYFRRALSQEKRRAEVVGAVSLPREPIKIEIKNSRENPVVIDRAEVDGGELYVYVTNRGRATVKWMQLRWALKAPDGTIVASKDWLLESYGGPAELASGERAELHIKIKADPRAVVLELTLHD